MACGLVGNEFVVFGGAGVSAADVWALDLTTHVWRQVVTMQPAPAARHSAAYGVWDAQVCMDGST